MTKPESRPPERTRPRPHDEYEGPLETVLELHPFPAIAVRMDTGAVVHANKAAVALRLVGPPPPDSDERFYAVNSSGTRIESRQIIPYLLSHMGNAEAVQITWSTPEKTFCFRVFCRQHSGMGGFALGLLTFLEITPQNVTEEELRASLEMRDELLSVATHELKDPLFSIQLSIQLLRHAAAKQGAIPPYVLQHLEVSDRQADRLARLIDNLLDVSRIDNHRLRLDRETLDLCELAREMVGRLQPKAHEAGATIEVQADEPVLGYFDRLKMEQVVGNLLTNAIKYGARRPITVRVRSENGVAILDVVDRGIGISPEDHDKIFERFERISQGYRRESLGLGLYIVRSLVEAHGGRITVHSQPGKGATFTIRLPRTRICTDDTPASAVLGTSAGGNHGG